MAAAIAGAPTGSDWRHQFAGALAALAPAARITRLGATLTGAVTAGTAVLPARVELTGDVTIVARRIQVTGRRLTVVAHGHTLRLYPVERLSADGTGSGAKALTGSPITIDVSGTTGGPGQTGFATGEEGATGGPGIAGPPTTFCRGNDGGEGQPGGDGGEGEAGGDGFPGNPAGSITLDIPDGSTDQYQLLARGGQGGVGGTGGPGGPGGRGGEGGQGGDATRGSPPDDGVLCDGGDGGRGGEGGRGGNGGTGGAGGAGTDGGTVTVTYPSQGYDPGSIAIDVSGGPGGGGGNGGSLGLPGAGGSGGQGGQPGPYGGSPGHPGDTGPGGLNGTTAFGAQGGSGGSGTTSVTPRGGPFSISLDPPTVSTEGGTPVSLHVKSATVANPAPVLTFDATGLPAGVSASFAPSTVPAGSSTELTLSPSSTTAAGAYQIDVAAMSGEGTVHAVLTLNVIGPPTGCSATNDTNVAITPGALTLSPIFIRGCDISGPIAITVSVHIVHPHRDSLYVSLRRPDHADHPDWDHRLKDHSTSDTRPNLDATYYVPPLAIAPDGGWTLLALAVLGGTGYVDSWSISFAPATPAPSAGPLTAVAAHSDLCLDATGWYSGAPATQQTCDAGAGQQWTFVPETIDDEVMAYRILAGTTGYCLQPDIAGQENGITILTRPCYTDHVSPMELWFLHPAKAGTYELVHLWSGLCVTVAGASTAAGALTVQGTCDDQAEQRWHLNG